MRHSAIAAVIEGALARLTGDAWSWSHSPIGQEAFAATAAGAADSTGRVVLAPSTAQDPVTFSPSIHGDREEKSAPEPLPFLNQQVAERLERSRAVQAEWDTRSMRKRLEVLGRLRGFVVARPRELAHRVPRQDLAETLAAEILPLLDACRFLEREAVSILRVRTLSTASRPMWLWGNGVTVRREPWGVVLVIAPSNYPLMIPGIQIVQAIAAGNAVLVKPAPGCSDPLIELVRLLESAGLPTGLVQILPTCPEAAVAAIHAGVDKVFLTGSAPAGQAIGRLLSERGIPSVMELSGCDAVFVLDDADVDLVCDSLLFGLTLNNGRTCIAPRRLFASPAIADRIVAGLRVKWSTHCADKEFPAVHERDARAAGEAIQRALASGARLAVGTFAEHRPDPLLRQPVVLDRVNSSMDVARRDLFAPVLSILRVAHEADALRENSRCPYALGASIFGSERRCRQIAERIPAGCVVINDMIVPSADPRVPFGGRRGSGHGVSRGAEGLLEMTQTKAVVATRRWFKPHLRLPTPSDANVLEQLIRLEHSSGFWGRLAAIPRLLRVGLEQLQFRRTQTRPTR